MQHLNNFGRRGSQPYSQVHILQFFAGNLHCFSGDRITGLSISIISKSSVAVIIMPSLWRYTLVLSFWIIKLLPISDVRISSFLLLKRKGLEIYFWMRKRLPFLHYLSTCCFILALFYWSRRLLLKKTFGWSFISVFFVANLILTLKIHR